MSKLLIGVLLLSFNVFSQNHVGDYSKYSLEVDGLGSGTGTVTGIMEVAINHRDARSGNYNMRSTTVLSSGVSLEENSELKPDEVFNHEAALQVLAYCSAFGGQMEEVSLGANTYQTCRISGEDLIDFGFKAFIALGERNSLESESELWIGDFPVTGIFKAIEFENRQKINLQITSFNWTE